MISHSTHSLIVAAVLGLFAFAGTVSADVLPVIGGTATGSGYENMGPFFDAQPAVTPAAGTTTDNMGSAGAFYTSAARGVYFDFGANWQTTNVSAIYFGLKQFGTDPTDPNATLVTFWSADTKLAYEPVNGDTPAPNFNLFTWTSPNTDKSWFQVWSGSVTPSARYLIVAFDGTQTASNRTQEIVFTGSIVPEPASLMLLGMGTLCLTCSSRRKN